MSPLRSQLAFFHQKDVHRLVKKIATSKNLVIYVGAGVTADQTGLTWSGLVARLLDHKKVDSGLSRLVLTSQAPKYAASVAAELYAKEHLAWTEQLVNDLRSDLYGKDRGEAGRLAFNLVRLAGNVKQRGGQVHFVTTNYDTHLEGYIDEYNEALPDQADDRLVPRIWLIDQPFADSAESSDGRKVVDFTYLHGRIDRTRGAAGAVVLREADYFATADAVRRRLTSILSEPDQIVLIVGSGLDDPPLLQALVETARKNRTQDRTDYTRFALYPLQSFGGADLKEEEIVQLKNIVDLRMKQFDALAVMPDFFYQLAQFVEELIVCSRYDSPRAISQRLDYLQADSLVRYGNRLTDWWSTWREHLTDLERAQSEAQQLLSAALEEISSLYFNSEECLRLELWVRWSPDEYRQLRLWALSSGTQLDVQQMRSAELDAWSDFLSVQAFCLGRPSQGSPTSESDRWKTVLSVPVYFDHQFGSLPLGVVALMSMKEPDRSYLRHGQLDVKQRGDIIARLHRVGGLLLAPPKRRRPSKARRRRA